MAREMTAQEWLEMQALDVELPDSWTAAPLARLEHERGVQRMADVLYELATGEQPEQVAP